MLPMIGMHNLFALGTLSASSEDEDHPMENAVDGLTYDYWRQALGSPISSEEYLRVDHPGGGIQIADYYGIAGHNMADVGASVKPQYWSGAAWVDAASVYTPPDNSPFMIPFTTVGGSRKRLLFTGYDDEFSIGVAMMGLRTDLYRGMPTDWAPPLSDNEEKEYTNNIAVKGQLLGRNFVRGSSRVVIPQNHVPRDWYEDVWLPLIDAGEENPFLFRWSEDHPEVIYGVIVDSSVRGSGIPGLYNVTITVEGTIR